MQVRGANVQHSNARGRSATSRCATGRSGAVQRAATVPACAAARKPHCG